MVCHTSDGFFLVVLFSDRGFSFFFLAARVAKAPLTPFLRRLGGMMFNSIQFNSIQLYFAMYTDTRNLFWYSPCRL